MNDFDCKQAILPYEEELLERLRKEYYYGIPLSIYVLSDSLTIHQYHYLSIHLTRSFSMKEVIIGEYHE